MWKKLRKNNKKGFTLVELIVVLVILAILAALLIPALTGYIDKAQEKQIVAETRQIVVAAQTLADEEYATLPNGYTIVFNKDGTGSTNTVAIAVEKAATPTGDSVEELSEVSGLVYGTNVRISVDKGKITEVVYTAHEKVCTYDVDHNTKNKELYDVEDGNTLPTP